MTETRGPAPEGSASSASVEGVVERVVDALVADGLIGRVDAERARAVVSGALDRGGPRPGRPTTVGEPQSLRGRLSEVLGYVGAVLVVSAGTLFVGQQWGRLGLGQRVVFLLVASLVLWLAGLLLVRSVGGRAGMLSDDQDVRRRLASVLLSAGSATTGGAVGAYLSDGPKDPGRLGALAFAVIAALALLGYLLAPSAAGQAVVALATAVAFGIAVAAENEWSALYVGLAVLVLGLGWLAVAERGRWRELLTGRVLGSGLAFAGAQVTLGAYEHDWVAYGLTFLLGVGAFAVYLLRRAWPYLALGIVSLTTSVTEAAMDWTQDSLGAAGGMLVAGVALLVSGLLGLRLRREAVS